MVHLKTNFTSIDILQSSVEVPVFGTTLNRYEAQGRAFEYLIHFSELNILATIRYIIWENGERHVECTDQSGHPFLHKACGRMRLQVVALNEEFDVVTLKTTLLKQLKPPHANLFNVESEYHLLHLGQAIEDLLLYNGAFEVGTKSDVYNDQSRSRNELCCCFERGNMLVPVLAFLVTRILALLYPVESQLRQVESRRICSRAG